MLFVLRLAPFCTAFSTILPCVQHQNTLHFAPKRTAFCGILHCVQQHIALYFASNSPKRGANGVLLELIFILPHSLANPFLHQNKPSRESIFCGKVRGWWTKRALIMLKLLLKTRQKAIVPYKCAWQWRGKHVRLLQPARAVAGLAAHGQRRQHHGNEEVN